MELLSGNYRTCLSAQSSLDDQDSHSKPCFGSTYSSRSLKQPKQQCENSSSEVKPKGVEENFEDETSMVINDLFPGFLTIGTLGLEKFISEPATPTFAMSLENITKEKIAVTENDLNLINDELEKFLEAEAEEEGSNESLGRNSQVSTITLGGKPIEGANAEDNGRPVVCPLQGYLFGSSIELSEIRIEVKKEKASLAELFHRTKILDESSTGKCGKAEMQANPIHKSSNHPNPFKKMLKKLHVSSRSSTPSKTDSASAKKKFHKVIQMFHKKIHPENSIAERELNKSNRLQINNISSYGGYISGDQIHPDNEKIMFPQESNSKEGILCYEKNSKWPQYGLRGRNSSGKREHWIKTDADYLVLEL